MIKYTPKKWGAWYSQAERIAVLLSTPKPDLDNASVGIIKVSTVSKTGRRFYFL